MPSRSIGRRAALFGIEDEIGELEDVAHGPADVVLRRASSANELPSSEKRRFETVRALQVVEAIAVLQVLQLVLEDEVEGRPEQTAEHGGLLGQAAEPEVDVVEAAGGGGQRTVKAGYPPSIKACAAARLAATVVAPVTVGCVAVGGDEVHERLGMPQAELELRTSCRTVEAPSRWVAAKNCFRATFSDGMPSLRPRAMLIAGRSSGRPTSVFRTEEVTNSSSSLPTWRTVPRTMLTRRPAAAVSGVPVPPSLYRAGLRNALSRRTSAGDAVGVGASHHLGQHRVTEAIDRMRELGRDRRVDRGDACRGTG